MAQGGGGSVGLGFKSLTLPLSVFFSVVLSTTPLPRQVNNQLVGYLANWSHQLGVLIVHFLFQYLAIYFGSKLQLVIKL